MALFGLGKFVKQFADKAGAGNKEISKLVGLQKHKKLVPLEGKAQVNRESALYRARKDVKKVLNPGWAPAKKGPPTLTTKPIAKPATPMPGHGGMVYTKPPVPSAGSPAAMAAVKPKFSVGDAVHFKSDAFMGGKIGKVTTHDYKGNPHKVIQYDVVNHMSPSGKGLILSVDEYKLTPGAPKTKEVASPRPYFGPSNQPSDAPSGYVKGPTSAAITPAAKKTGGLGALVRQATDGRPDLYGSTDKQRQALGKLVGLKKLRDVKPLPQKSKENVNRQSAIYRANKDVKKLFADIAQGKTTAEGAQKGLFGILKFLKNVDPKLADPARLARIAAEQGLQVSRLFVKSTGVQLSQSQFDKIFEQHGKIPKNPHVKSSILHYSASGYGAINDSLRKADQHMVNGRFKHPKGELPIDQHTAQHIANIDHAIAQSKFEKDTRVVRGMHDHEALKFLDTIEKGGIWTDHGYSSTGAFKPFGGKYQMVIHAQKGQQGMAIPSHHSHEKEFLMPRGARYKVFKRVNSGGKVFLHVQMLSPAPVPITKPKFDPSKAETPAAGNAFITTAMKEFAEEKAMDYDTVPSLVKQIKKVYPELSIAQLHQLAQEGINKNAAILKEMEAEGAFDEQTKPKTGKVAKINEVNIVHWATGKLNAGNHSADVKQEMLENFNVTSTQATQIMAKAITASNPPAAPKEHKMTALEMAKAQDYADDMAKGGDTKSQIEKELFANYKSEGLTDVAASSMAEKAVLKHKPPKLATGLEPITAVHHAYALSLAKDHYDEEGIEKQVKKKYPELSFSQCSQIADKAMKDYEAGKKAATKPKGKPYTPAILKAAATQEFAAGKKYGMVVASLTDEYGCTTSEASKAADEAGSAIDAFKAKVDSGPANTKFKVGQQIRFKHKPSFGGVVTKVTPAGTIKGISSTMYDVELADGSMTMGEEDKFEAGPVVVAGGAGTYVMHFDCDHEGDLEHEVDAIVKCGGKVLESKLLYGDVDEDGESSVELGMVRFHVDDRAKFDAKHKINNGAYWEKFTSDSKA